MSLRFLPAEQSDTESLFALNKALIEQYEDLSAVNLDQILPWVRKKLQNKSSEYRAAFLNDEKVGYFRLCEGDDGSLELDDLYIFTPYRGQGIGSDILRHCIRESEKLQRPLTLYVYSGNTGAIRLYERFGFHIKEIVSPTRSIMKRPIESLNWLSLSDDQLIAFLRTRIEDYRYEHDLFADQFAIYTSGAPRTFFILSLLDQVIRNGRFLPFFAHEGVWMSSYIADAYREIGSKDRAVLFERLGERHKINWRELYPEHLAQMSNEESEDLTEWLLSALNCSEFISAYMQLDQEQPFSPLLAAYARSRIGEFYL